MNCKLCNRKFVRFEFQDNIFSDVCPRCLERYRGSKDFDWKAAVQHEWTVDDWRDFYEAIDFALWRIARRQHATSKIDYQI